MKTLQRLAQFLRPFWASSLLAVLTGTATVAAGIGLLGTSAYLIATASLRPSVAVLQVAIVGVRFFGISRGVFRYLERLVSHSVNFRLLAELRVWFYQAVEPLAPGGVEDLRAGDVLSRASGDIDALENFFVRAAAPGLTALVITTGVSLFAAGYAASMALALLGGLSIACILLPLFVYWAGRGPGRRVAQARTVYSTWLVDTLQGLTDYSLYGKDRARLAVAAGAGRALARAQKDLAGAGAAANAFQLLVSGATLCIVLWVGVPLVRAGVFDGVSLAVLALMSLAAFEVAGPLGQAAQTLELSLASARRLFEIADAPIPTREPATPCAAPESGALAVEKVTFRYPQSRQNALHEVSLTLPEGKRMALVGPSGAGKSTLVDLLLRFRLPDSGRIGLGTCDTAEMGSEAVRRVVAASEQRVHLFSATLKQNLALTRPDAPEGEIGRAAQIAGLEPLIESLPNGLDTWIGAQGAQLSGGERRRVAIARALLASPQILVLDEPFAGLDPLAARGILERLLATWNGSLLLVTHQFIGMDSMDEIAVLNAGEISQRGSHLDLIATEGWYARAWNVQRNILPDAPAEPRLGD